MKYLLLLALLITSPLNGQMGPTVTRRGTFRSVSPAQIVTAVIDGEFEQVCLPQINFPEGTDISALRQYLSEGLQNQEAIFHLYHDGLGRPLRRAGMLYASDVYLQEIKMTYSGFIRNFTRGVTISNVPPHEDEDRMRTVLYEEFDFLKKDKTEKEPRIEAYEGPDEKDRASRFLSGGSVHELMVSQILPAHIRQQEEELRRRLEELKNMPYEKEVVEIGPVRWAAGIMGTINYRGEINNAIVEGQRLNLIIAKPDINNWLSDFMREEIENQACEFIIQRLPDGSEAKIDGRYYLRDIYFIDQKMSWRGWLRKHHIQFDYPECKPGHAKDSIKLDVKLKRGTWQRFRAAALCEVNFDSDSDLAGTKTLRITPPELRPSNFAAHARNLDRLLNGKRIEITMLVDPKGNYYTELGQLRAQRIYIPSRENTLRGLLNLSFRGNLK